MEYHGFVTIRTAQKAALDYQRITEIVQSLNAEANSFEYAHFVELNGEWFFTAHSNHNHASAFKPMREFLEQLINMAPSSYGLFPLLDDDDPVPQLREV